MAILKQSHHFLKVLYCAWSISIPAGLPNAKGDIINQALFNQAAASGIISTSSGKTFGSGNTKYTSKLFNIDLSRASTIYKDDYDTVTPESLTTLLLIKY